LNFELQLNNNLTTGTHFSLERCALLKQEVRTSFLGIYHTPPTALRNHPPLCCATQHLLLRNKIGTPPKLRISESPSNESKKLCGLKREPKPMPSAAVTG
jgi:hypothetical protein